LKNTGAASYRHIGGKYKLLSLLADDAAKDKEKAGELSKLA
jgi:hypothetical protein